MMQVLLATDLLHTEIDSLLVGQMTLSDGRIKTFDVPFEQFHQLRYNVAKVRSI